MTFGDENVQKNAPARKKLYVIFYVHCILSKLSA